MIRLFGRITLLKTFVFLLIATPIWVFAGNTYNGVLGAQADMVWAVDNAGPCTVTSSYSGASGVGGVGNFTGTIGAGSSVQNLTEATPGVSYTISCYSTHYGMDISDTATLIVTGGSAPTSASLSLSSTFGPPARPFTISWSGNNSPTEYFYKIDSGVETSLGAVTSVVVTADDFEWESGSTHTLAVKACNSFGCSPYTGTQSYTVTPPPDVRVDLSMRIKELLKDFFSLVLPTESHDTFALF